MSKIVHLFRHGQTDWNIQRKMQGHTDIPLNEEGRQQALSLQNYFAQNPVDLFMASDLTRAQETAQIANGILMAPFHTSAGLRETFLGAIEGLTQEEVHQKFGIDPWEKWLSMNPQDFDFAFPGGETTIAAISRFSVSLTEFCENFNFKSAGVCTHGLIMRRFLHSIKPELTEPLPIPNCVVYKVEWDEVQKRFIF